MTREPLHEGIESRFDLWFDIIVLSAVCAVAWLIVHMIPRRKRCDR